MDDETRKLVKRVNDTQDKISEGYKALRNAFDELMWAAKHGGPGDYADAYAAFDQIQRNIGGIAARIANERFNQTTT